MTAGTDKKNRRDLGKCTHQYDEKQRNNSTLALSTKKVSSSDTRRQTTKEEGRKEEGRKEEGDVRNVEGADVKNVNDSSYINSFLSILFFTSVFFCCLST